MPGIVAFGEMMLHLSPPSFQRLRQAGSFNAVYGGSEANTAAALAQWGEHAVFITKLPENELGDACVSVLRSYGVDTSFIMRGEGRIGIYFSEKGASQRPQLVLYDRQNSVFSLSGPGDFDFTSAMAGADWFHFSGITPALGDNLVGLTKTALNTARSRGLKISCDFNYRSKLWSEEKARHAMRELMTGIDVLIINENQAGEVFGVNTEDGEKTAAEIAGLLRPRLTAVTKRRTVSGEVQEFSALLYDGSTHYRSRTYSIFLVDKIGGGDAFNAGLIYSLRRKKSLYDAVEFAAAAACAKHTVEGDILSASVSEIEWIMRSDGRGRMTR